MDIGPKKISSRLMSLFLKQLSLLLNSGINLSESLETIREQNLDKRLNKSLELVLEGLDKGYSTYSSFLLAKSYYPDMALAFFKSGEKTGKLGLILEDLSDFIFEDSKNKSTIKEAMTYPILLLCVTIFVIIAIVQFVMPSFISVFQASGQELPLATRVLIGLSNMLSNYYFIIILIVLILVLIFLYLRTDPRTKLIIDRIYFEYGPFKKIRMLHMEYQLTSLFYILRRGDIDPINSFDIIGESFKNTYVKSIFAKVCINLKQGLDFTTSFKNAGIFTSLLLSMIKLGEKTGKLDNTLKKANDYYKDEYLFRIKKLANIAEPLMILIMSALVGFVVFSVALPMFDSVNMGVY